MYQVTATVTKGDQPEALITMFRDEKVTEAELKKQYDAQVVNFKCEKVN